MKTKQLLWHQCDQWVHLEIRKHQKSVPLHTHDFNELVFILRGSGLHIVDEEKYPLIRGDVFVIKGNQAHKFEKNKNMYVANLEYLWERFKYFEKELIALPEFKALFIYEPLYRKKQKFKAKLHLDGWQLNEVISVLDLIKKEEMKKQKGYNLMLESLFKIVVITICRYYLETKQAGPNSLLKITTAINYIETYFTENISRQTLAEKVGMNFNTFCKTFKETTGCSPIDYLIRFRIEKAIEMMNNNPKIKVIDAAINCGFESSSYFSKKFKQISGISPKEYLLGQKNNVMPNGHIECLN